IAGLARRHGGALAGWAKKRSPESVLWLVLGCSVTSPGAVVFFAGRPLAPAADARPSSPRSWRKTRATSSPGWLVRVRRRLVRTPAIGMVLQSRRRSESKAPAARAGSWPLSDVALAILKEAHHEGLLRARLAGGRLRRRRRGASR